MGKIRIRSRASKFQKRHGHLGVILDCAKKHHVVVGMMCYQEAACKEFPEEIKPNIKSPWNNQLFNTGDDSSQLCEDES